MTAVFKTVEAGADYRLALGALEVTPTSLSRRF